MRTSNLSPAVRENARLSREARLLLPSMIQVAEEMGLLMEKYGRRRDRLGAQKIGLREKSQNQGLVTEADLACEALGIRRLSALRSDMGFLTEENQRTPKVSAPRGRWILDPIDGTTNFVQGFPMYAVSLGLELEGKLCAGVIHHSSLRQTYWAGRNLGAFRDRTKLRVSSTSSLRTAVLTTGFTLRRTQSFHTEVRSFERLSRATHAVRRPGAASLDLAYTASGVFDGFWEHRLAPWDIAAGILLVEEAGGKVTDFQGNPIELGDRHQRISILAASRTLHSSILGKLA